MITNRYISEKYCSFRRSLVLHLLTDITCSLLKGKANVYFPTLLLTTSSTGLVDKDKKTLAGGKAVNAISIITHRHLYL